MDEVRLSLDEVRKVAGLARLELTEAELESSRTALAAVLGYAARLGALDLTGVEPLASLSEGRGSVGAGVLREDEPGATLPNSVLMSMAPATDPPFVRVPKVIGEGGGA